MALKENIKEKRFILPKKSGNFAKKDHFWDSDYARVFKKTSLDPKLQDKNIKQNLAICGKSNAK